MSTREQDQPHDPVKIHQLPTGVPGMDEILGGGLPEYSFNIIAGAPGCGKTTLAHQIMFANASPKTPALYFTVLGESVPGLHTFRITRDGMQTFPRTFALAGKTGLLKGRRRLSNGIRQLDVLLGGGVLEGDSLLLAGPSGSGKSLLGTYFIAEGLRQGEPVKMRRSEHSIDMVEYQITAKGAVIGAPLRGYRGLTSGIPSPWSSESGEAADLRAEANDPNE